MEQKKKKGESISKQEYIKCYHSAADSTPDRDATKKEVPNKDQINKAREIAPDTRKFEIGLYWKRTAYDGNTTKEEIQKKEAPNKDLINKALEIALDTRKFEIELYWKRTGYFVLFIGAVFVGYYKVLQIRELSDSEKEWLLLLLAALGFLLSLLWYMANRGSKFWQENWEAHIEELSTEIGVPIFGIIKIHRDTKLNFMGLYPFSVSRINQMASLIITFSWLIILLKEMGGGALLENYDFKTCYKTAVGFAIIVLSFFVIRWCKGFVAKLPKDGSSNGKEKKNFLYLIRERLKEFFQKFFQKFFHVSHKDRNGKEIYYFWNYSKELKYEDTEGETAQDGQ